MPVARTSNRMPIQQHIPEQIRYSSFKTYHIMDIIATATRIGERLLPYFLKSKTIAQIGKEISEAADTELGLLWKKVKPWFIEEYEEEKPLGDTFEKEDVKGVVKRALNKADDDTKNAIDELLKKLEAGQSNSGNTATVTGSGNIVIQGVSGNGGGININTPQKD
jgi:hypothetical protein